MNEKLTLGESRVRTKFNPSAGDDIDEIKQAAAKLIDLIDAVPDGDVYETKRLKSLGMTAVEEAAMWGVKAATARFT